MKKYIGIGLIMIVLAVIAAGAFIVNDSREYFKEYFEAKRTKLDLRQESSVDSLLQVITNLTITRDSLVTALDNEKKTGDNVTNSLREQVKTLERSVKNLNNVITHQNKMIDELRAKTTN